MRPALLAAAAAVAVVAPAPARAAPTISMSGEEVTESLVADLAYFYSHAVRHPPRFDLTGGGTDAGIADAQRGVTSAAMVSRDLAADDPADLVLTRLATSGLCLVSNRSNRVPGLTRAQVQDLVAGRLTSWTQIPGAARTDAIVPVSLAATTGGGRVFGPLFVDADTPVAWQAVTLLTPEQARDYVAGTRPALGYVDLALTQPLHVIPFDGIDCTRRTIRNGTYPARLPIGIVTRGRPRGALRRFLHWALTSRTARRVIATRYIPG